MMSGMHTSRSIRVTHAKGSYWRHTVMISSEFTFMMPSGLTTISRPVRVMLISAN